MTKGFVVVIVSIIFWLFVPIMMMYLNISGFTEVNPELIRNINAEDFNIITLSGFATFATFIFGLAKFTITGLHAIWITFFTAFGLIDAVAIIYFIRRGEG